MLHPTEELKGLVVSISPSHAHAADEKSGALIIAPLRAGASVGQLAHETLRNAIIGMDVYAEGADLRLDEKQLADALGVSRTPVRQALARLEHEGLVRIVPRRGVYIVRKSKHEIVEMIVAWAALESMAARLTCERASDDAIAGLRHLFASFAEADRVRGRLDEYSDANLRFHQRIVELGQSTLITAMADGLLVHLRAIRTRTIGDEDRPERSLADHLHIIEALEAREAEVAERLARDHALNLADHVRRTVDHLD